MPPILFRFLRTAALDKPNDILSGSPKEIGLFRTEWSASTWPPCFVRACPRMSVLTAFEPATSIRVCN